MVWNFETWCSVQNSNNYVVFLDRFYKKKHLPNEVREYNKLKQHFHILLLHALFAKELPFSYVWSCAKFPRVSSHVTMVGIFLHKHIEEMCKKFNLNSHIKFQFFTQLHNGTIFNYKFHTSFAKLLSKIRKHG